ncbi:MAG: glutamate N-acetyltransferase/amino-acid N-acetyltransferase [Cyclobacteriaceae bacterium]|jgi:glutamate N-acetyltransferase/amino-acid N-acetyltransferase
MAVGSNNSSYHKVAGVRLSSLACGVKRTGNDLVLIEFAPGSHTAGVFTQSIFAAAPVVVGKAHLQHSSPRYFLINSGNANAGVGDAGIKDAIHCCRALAELADTPVEAVLPFSTGVIGERLPAEKIVAALGDALGSLDEDGWMAAARGIMTTDTRPKIASRQFDLGGKVVTITGITKGAGMIQPNMATMLSYVATDVAASTQTLQQCLGIAVNKSFNRITVDSDTSTNDSSMLTATGQSGVDIDVGGENQSGMLGQFQVVLDEVFLELAQGIIRDAEGATKFVAVTVNNGKTVKDCLSIAYSIANSPLMKTAIHASDANWGRIVMAIGKAGVALDINKLDIWLGDACLMQAGQKHEAYTEIQGAAIMACDEITITIDLHAGSVSETVWTSDLSQEYVRINADYRS